MYILKKKKIMKVVLVLCREAMDVCCSKNSVHVASESEVFDEAVTGNYIVGWYFKQYLITSSRKESIL